MKYISIIVSFLYFTNTVHADQTFVIELGDDRDSAIKAESKTEFENDFFDGHWQTVGIKGNGGTYLNRMCNKASVDELKEMKKAVSEFHNGWRIQFEKGTYIVRSQKPHCKGAPTDCEEEAKGLATIQRGNEMVFRALDDKRIFTEFGKPVKVMYEKGILILQISDSSICGGSSQYVYLAQPDLS